MDIKSHFAWVAVVLLGKDKSLELVREICVANKINAKKRRSFESQIMNFKKIDTVKKQKVEVIKEVNYEQGGS